MKQVILILVLAVSFSGMSQQPLYSWDFGDPNPLQDKISGKKINLNVKNCNFELISNKDTSYLTGSKAGCILPLDVFTKSFSNSFSFEFDFKGEEYNFTSYPQPYVRFIFRYNYIQFSTAVMKNGKEIYDNWVIPLDGKKGISYFELADDQWHHIVYRANSITGEKQIVIDGKEYEHLKKIGDVASSFLFTNSSGFLTVSGISRLSVYDKFLSDETLLKNYSKNFKEVPGRSASKSKITKVDRKAPDLDPLDFAPGHPNYPISLLDQLKGFPLPRYPVSRKVFRNFSWMDIMYLHRELPVGSKGFGKISPSNAVALTDEMTSNWNYYVDLPCLRSDSVHAAKIYSDPSTVQHALIKYANDHQDRPSGSITFQAQVKPVHAGFESSQPYIYSQNLSSEYYLNDSKGKEIVFQGKKWISPLAPLDVFAKDGLTSGFYLRQLNKFLIKPVAFISENGEVFGHRRPDNLLRKDPDVAELMDRLNLDNSSFNGWFLNRLDSAYRVNLLRSSGNNSAYYTMYEMTAVNDDFWPGFATRINTNSKFDGGYRSTPSFYPVSPDNWRFASGPWSGYGVIAEGRSKEIKLGVKRFAPFVSAGWSHEEKNLRPAQWLALLKSMVMLGADFFHVGYFNVTNSKGQWPNGSGPNDPRGYAYQVAMPAYAQAMAVDKFIDKGELLNVDFVDDKIRKFRFKGKRENELILVRRIDNRYLIYGSVQPMSNNKGDVPDSVVTTIRLENKLISFWIRRQGSMYVLDISNTPAFFQLDGWHQKEHPYYWSKTIKLESEVAEELNHITIHTEQTAGPYDFRKFVSFIRMKQKAEVTYPVPARTAGLYQLNLKARSNKDVTIKVTIGENTYSVKTTGSTWTLVSGPKIKVQAIPNELVTLKASADLDLDYVELIPLYK